MAGDYIYRDDMNGSQGKKKSNDPIEELIEWYQEDDIHDPVENAWNGEMETENDYWFQSLLMGIPGINSILGANWSLNDLKSYMSKYNLTWTDLISGHVFSKFGNSLGRQTVNFVGDMVKELYT